MPTEKFVNQLGQPIGRPLPGWVPPPFPPHQAIVGRTCSVEPLSPDRHAADLYNAFAADTSGAMWTYLPVGPFTTLGDLCAWMEGACLKQDPQLYAFVNADTRKAVGFGSLMRIDPTNGCIEVGFLAFSPAMQRTTISTEAMYLLMRRAFDLGYRRYEWKCNALNLPSRATAERLGFQYEGTFRQAIVTKGHNRDTAWYSVIDSEWPDLKRAFEAWLSPDNFDRNSWQIARLTDLRNG